MSYTYLAEQEGGFLEECYSDTPQFALWKSNHTAAACSCNGSGMACCHASPFGMTCEPSMVGLGGGGLMPSAEGSHAKTSAAQAEARESEGPGADCGGKWHESFAKWNPDTSSWKIRQIWLFEDSAESLETWPRWGIMHDGECWEPATSAGIARGEGCGFLPRPQRVDGQKWYVVNKAAAERRVTEGRQLMLIHVVGLTAYAHLNRWLANPPFWEAMMEWPIGWTDCTPLETDKFQAWLRSHG